jgi:hypothetical protein
MGTIKEKEYKKQKYYNNIPISKYALFFRNRINGLELEIISILGGIRLSIWNNNWYNMCDELFSRESICD